MSEKKLLVKLPANYEAGISNQPDQTKEVEKDPWDTDLNNDEFREKLDEAYKRGGWTDYCRLLVTTSTPNLLRRWCEGYSERAFDKIYWTLYDLSSQTHPAGYWTNKIFGIYDSLSGPYRALRKKQNPAPLPTGIINLDEFLGGGLLPGVYVIGGAPSTGKSALMLQMASNMMNYVSQAYFSLEMSEVDISARIQALGLFMTKLAKKDNEKDKKEDNQKVISVNDMLQKRSELIDTAEYKIGWEYWRSFKSKVKIHVGQPSIYDLRYFSCINRMKNPDLRKEYNIRTDYFNYETIENYMLDMVQHLKEIDPDTGEEYYKTMGFKSPSPVFYIDLLQRLDTSNANAMDRFGELINKMDRFALANSVTIIVASAVSRDDVYQPFSSISFKESGTIESTADFASGLQFSEIEYVKKPLGSRGGFRPYDDSDLDRLKAMKPRYMTLHVTKYRNGDPGRLDFVYYSDYNYFFPWDCKCDHPQQGHKYQPKNQ